MDRYVNDAPSGAPPERNEPQSEALRKPQATIFQKPETPDSARQFHAHQTAKKGRKPQEKPLFSVHPTSAFSTSKF
jgi:hypothetical protein